MFKEMFYKVSVFASISQHAQQIPGLMMLINIPKIGQDYTRLPTQA